MLLKALISLSTSLLTINLFTLSSIQPFQSRGRILVLKHNWYSIGMNVIYFAGSNLNNSISSGSSWNVFLRGMKAMGGGRGDLTPFSFLRRAAEAAIKKSPQDNLIWIMLTILTVRAEAGDRGGPHILFPNNICWEEEANNLDFTLLWEK